MHTNRRRCCSEQVPRATKRVIPSHKAFEVRQAQLREAQIQSLSPPELGKTIRIETSHKDEKEVDNRNRQSSAPVPLQQQNNQIPEVQNTSHTSLSQEQQSGRGPRDDKKGSFLSIDAIIAGSRSRDNRRQLGETEFYEHIGDDRVIRRRSMMRTVNKDDCLVGRGANPRTGLITPDWNSVTSSIDNDHTHSVRRDRPSAQWRLDGDAWVSVPPQAQLADCLALEHTGAEESVPLFDQMNSAASSRKTSRHSPATALTEKNLRTFSNQSQLDELADKIVPISTEPIEEVRIKRKPVGSPSALPSSGQIIRDAIRSVSHDTVVHSSETKSPLKHQAYPKYYSPDSVGIGLSSSDALSFPQRARNGGPFLGGSVELLNSMVSQPRGFTSKATNRNQLQQSLRMSSGPYPSHPLNQQAALGKEGRLLHATQIQHECHQRRLDPLRDQPVAHQPALRAYHPDDATSYRLTEPRYRAQDLPGFGLQNGRKHPHQELTPIINSQEDYRYPDLRKDSNTQQMLNTTYTTTSIHIPTSGRRIDQDMTPRHHGFTLSARDISLDRDHRVIDSIEKSPESAGACMHIETRSARRPQLGPREQDMLGIPRVRIRQTDTVHRSHLNTIGTKAVLPGETNEDRTNEKLTESARTPFSTASVASSEPASPVTNDQLMLYSPDRHDTPDTNDQESATSSDHTVCCPECCVKFDCHGGCLGHPSPYASAAGSETSSLVSMRVFDASFETSVKAINKVLLTPMEKDTGRLAKVRTMFGWRSGASSPTELSPRPNTMKRTLREESLSQKVNVGLYRPSRLEIKRPHESDAKQAKTAAARVLDAGESSKENPIDSSKARAKTKDKINTSKTAKTTVKKKKTVEVAAEANEGRRAISKPARASKTKESKQCTLPSSSSETTLVSSESEGKQDAKETANDGSIADDHHTETVSMVDRLSIFIRRNSYMMRPKRIDLPTLTDPVLLSYVQSVAVRSKDMTVTVGNTTAVIIAIVLEYNKSGKLIMPAGMSTNELAGDLLRSVLYLMVATCVYALFVKAGRFTLAVLRVVLFPVRICAWIIG